MLTDFGCLGTWKGEAGKVKAAVSFSLQNGYKLVDCAYCYANEIEVGEGLKEAFAAGVKREDIFVTSKLWGTYETSDERVELGLDKSLKALGLDYLDLFMVVSAARAILCHRATSQKMVSNCQWLKEHKMLMRRAR